jgi:hypothetical protein
MSSIPYNYGSYIDAKVAITDTGHVSSGKQIQSPASAGSRGLAKTTQFTNDRTQMQMGNSPIAESMVEIRSILNRIDGVNAPVQEDAGEKIANMAQNMTKDQFMGHADELGLTPEEAAEHYEKMQGGAHVPEDSGELARLKELSGIEEDAGLTDEQKKGIEAIAKKYKDREGGNGDMLAYGYLDVSDTGIPTDGYDKEEMEAYSKKIGVDWREWDGQQSEDFLNQSETTGGATAFMIDDLIKVLGQNFMNDEKLQFSAKEYLDSLGSNYEPMPEGDEFDIEEDEDFEEVLGPLGFPEDETELFDAEYQGRKVPLNKPMRGDTKKFKVYVKDPKTGNVKKVNFGHGGTSAKRKTMRIRKSNPKARKSFRARHNCANPGPKTKARYWSCRKW